MEHIKANLISVIVRAHDPKKDWVLINAIESLSAQSHKNLEIIVVLQGYNEGDLLALDISFKRLLSSSGIAYQIELLKNPNSQDLRSYALNRGLALSNGHRIAFLDYDDVFYPNALERLSKAMDSSQAGCVVGATDLSYVEYDYPNHKLKIIRKERFFTDKPTVERLRHNSFIPIHSFLLDKKKLAGISFREDMRLFEDYVFLLELSTVTNFDFSLFKEGAICEYRVEKVGGASINSAVQKNPYLYREQRKKIWEIRERLGFLNVGFYIKHPLYYPIRTKLLRFFKNTQ